MVTICSAPDGFETIADFLIYPSGCFYFFWLIVMEVIFIVIALSIHNKEKDNQIQSDLISCLGVSGIATIFLSLIGTLITGSTGIPLIQQEIMLYILAINLVFIVIWIFKRN